jgi:flagellar basal-body rod protein FlgC
MGLFSVLDVSSAGLSVERTRLDVAAANLANARTSGGSQGAYQPMQVIAHSVIAPDGTGSTVAGHELPVPVVVSIAPRTTQPQLVYDPGHPDADGQGFVRLPGVDPVDAMTELVSISRGYEANLRVFDVTRSLLQRLLSLGGRS